ncbi:MAG: ATP-binding protein [Thainema sp.]
MPLDATTFYQACNPGRPLEIQNNRDRDFYVDFSTVRGGDVIHELTRTITRLSPEEPTCQLFTGHIGCGKSTELFRLKYELEQQGFHVVYFESDRNLEVADVDISDILLVIAYQVDQSLIAEGIQLKSNYFRDLFEKLRSWLQMPFQISEVSFSMGIAEITAEAKASPELRSQLRQYLEPRTKTIIDAVNRELLVPAIATLKAQGKKGLVVIMDNLDRVESTKKISDRTQPEYLFIDRGMQLRQLKCHMVYTMPLSLIFSNDQARLTSRFGSNPKVLPMVPVQTRSGEPFIKGLALMRRMAMVRAFPTVDFDVDPDQFPALLPEVFDNLATLDRVCQASGGHVRNLLRLITGCLQKQDPPIQRSVLESVIRDERDNLSAPLSNEEWQLLFNAVEQRSIQGDEDYNLLLRGLFLFEYRDQQGRWFDINPILAEAEPFKQWAQHNRL